jgi:hypothetical protein
VNKLQGFYELRRIRIPSISWREFTPHTTLSPDKLWTIRVAVAQGNDFNLPRAVGLNAADATIKGREFIQAFPPPDLVIYYPYFLARVFDSCIKEKALGSPKRAYFFVKFTILLLSIFW